MHKNINQTQNAQKHKNIYKTKITIKKKKKNLQQLLPQKVSVLDTPMAYWSWHYGRASMP